MKTHQPLDTKGFTLLEVMVSLGIFVFAITIILTSLGSSASSAANDARRSQAAGILDSCFHDLALASESSKSPSPMYKIDPISWKTTPGKLELWFDGNGKPVAGVKQAFFKCEIISTKDPAAPLGNMHGRIDWPAKREKGAPDGEVELFTSILLP